LSSTRRAERILFLCTANICRSPTAEYLARHHFGSDRWAFRSAGFLESGRSPTGELIRSLGEVGVDIRNHRSYRVDVASLQAADLVLTMEGTHVRRASEIWPDVLAKIVPLRQAATLLEADGAAGDVSDLIDRVVERRDPSDYLGPRWDVADPYGRSLRVYRRSVAEIDALIGTVFSTLDPRTTR
jgi:protein-tyrosine-phosphatase